MDRATLNNLLLNLGISTAGLAFGLSMPIMLRLLRKALHFRRHSRHPEVEAWGMMILVGASTAAMVMFKEHITIRRIFLLVATSIASLVLWIVRNVGTCTREDCE